MARLILLALAVCIMSPATARAWELDRARQVAETVWGNPCAKPVPITFRDAPLTPTASMNARGLAYYPTCEIFLRTDVNAWNEICPVVLHEMGHLAGMKHSDNPFSVMHDPPMYDQRCNDRGRPYLERRGKLTARSTRTRTRVVCRWHRCFSLRSP